MTYTADPVNGFNAVVDRSAPAAPAIARVAAPAYAAAPLALGTRYAAPALATRYI